MRTIFVTLLTALVLSGAAMAQPLYDSGWAGVSGGYPGAGVHVGIEDGVGLEGLSVRLNFGYDYVAPVGFAIGADLLYALPLDTGDLPGGVYIGVGGSTILSTSFTVHGFAGLEVPLAEVGLDLGMNEFSIFAEGGVNYGLNVFDGADASNTIGFVGRAGVNYHFDF